MLGAGANWLACMYFLPPSLVMTAEIMYPKSNAMITYTQMSAVAAPSNLNIKACAHEVFLRL